MAEELHILSVLYSIREDLFSYNNSATPHKYTKNLIEEYLTLLPENLATQTYLKVLAKLQAQTIQTDFSLEKWRKLAIQDEDILATQAKAVNKENTTRSANNKKFKQEDTFRQKIINELRFKGCEVDDKDLLSVRVEDGKKLRATFADGSTETINILKYGKKNMTSVFWNLRGKIDNTSSSLKKKEFSKQQEDFLSPTQLQTLIDNKEMTFATVKQEIINTKPEHKNMTLLQYKKLAGSSEFLPNIEKEYKIYSKLSFIHQKQFLEEIKLRKEYMDKSLKIFKKLCHDATDLSKLKQIANQSFLLSKLSEALDLPAHPLINQAAVLPNQKALESTVSDVLTHVIEDDIKGETGQLHIWSYFNKTPKNPRYSPYEILLNNAVNTSKTIHSEIFHFDTEQQMRTNIVKALSEIKSQRLILTDNLAAEILCIGVFNAGVKRAQNMEDLAKMNKILNEFGLNIRFEEREITKIPPHETCNDYLTQERQKFREDRAHKSLTYAFEDFLKSKFGKMPHKKELHHFLPLRYNGFINEELNRKNNYVAVASQHVYNLDLHGLGHTYDTPDNSLVRDETGQISSMIYSKMRKDGLGKKLLIPILQIKTNNGFEDALSIQKHQRITTDKTPVCYAQVPENIAKMLEVEMVQSNLKKPAHGLS